MLSGMPTSDNYLYEGASVTTPLPPGWYPDPDGKAEKLYWDGHQWYAAPPPQAAPKPAAVTTPTPAPTSVTQCFKCNHRQVVAKSTTGWVCEQCGQELKRASSPGEIQPEIPPPKKPAQYSSWPMGTLRSSRRDSPLKEVGDAGGAFASNIDKNTAVAIGVCVLVAIGVLMSMQSVSLLTGTGPIWTGVGFVAAGTAVAFFMRAATWVRVVAAVSLAFVLANAFYMEQQLSDKRNEISQIFDNSG